MKILGLKGLTTAFGESRNEVIPRHYIYTIWSVDEE